MVSDGRGSAPEVVFMKAPIQFVVVCGVVLLSLLAWTGSAAAEVVPLAGPSFFVADFVATAADGFAMNDAGDVAGRAYLDNGCQHPCLPPQRTVVWRGGNGGGQAIILPEIPGLTPNWVTGINADGWVVGFAGSFDFVHHAVLWKPNGPGYEAIDLGVLPGTDRSEASGIDDFGRVVGWSTTGDFFPVASPFMWSEETGMIDLAAEGYPDEKPGAISPGGTVATATSWYRLGDPGSVTLLPPPPPGFFPPGAAGVINDAGDQARFLVSTSGENLLYLFRFHHEGTWQQISPAGTGRLSRAGLGSINDARDVTATVLSTGVIAYGPDGLAQNIIDLLAPPYRDNPESAISTGGPMNDAGQILAEVLVGRSFRLVRLTPAEPCLAGCAVVSAFQMKGKFIPDPRDPDGCTPLAANLVGARMKFTDEGGSPVAGARVRGHFLDDYWLDHVVTGRTDAQGRVSFRHKGPACVGAVAFLLTDLAKSGRVLDRTDGTVTGYVIPLP